MELAGLEPATSWVRSVHERSRALAPVRRNCRFAGILSDAAEPIRSRANPERCHCCHAPTLRTPRRASPRAWPAPHRSGPRKRSQSVADWRGAYIALTHNNPAAWQALYSKPNATHSTRTPRKASNRLPYASARSPAACATTLDHPALSVSQVETLRLRFQAGVRHRNGPAFLPCSRAR